MTYTDTLFTKVAFLLYAAALGFILYSCATPPAAMADEQMVPRPDSDLGFVESFDTCRNERFPFEAEAFHMNYHHYKNVHVTVVIDEKDVFVGRVETQLQGTDLRFDFVCIGNIMARIVHHAPPVKVDL